MRLCRLVVTLLGLIVLSGCVPTVISTEHDYVLLRQRDDRLVVLEDDDPLYAAFDIQVRGSAYIKSLLTMYEHITEAFIAINAHSPYSQTIANKPVIVLDTGGAGLVRDVVAWYGETKVPVELALGLGVGASVDLGAARRALPSAIAPLYLTLLNVPAPQGASDVADDEPGSAERALWQGFAAALDAGYAAREPAVATESDPTPAGAERQRRYRLVAGNGLAYRYENGQPTNYRWPEAEAMRTPGVVGTFFYRLLSEMTSYYPQRHMLWFANFEGDETAFAKVCLALLQMPADRPPSVGAFVDTYARTYPSERQFVIVLAQEVFGPQVEPLLGG